MAVPLDPEFDLLSIQKLPNPRKDALETAKSAPVVTGDAFARLSLQSALPQRAVLGRIINQSLGGHMHSPQDARLYFNVNTPSSGVICGVQGAGKSHTTSTLLENCLISDSRLGRLPKPLSGLVFHYNKTLSGIAAPPCEAAYIAQKREPSDSFQAPSVTVLVAPHALQAMEASYATIPGVKVRPLHFATTDITADRMLAMMQVDAGKAMPLYIHRIMSILREMASGTFDYNIFKAKVKAEKWTDSQLAPLELRMALLESFLHGGSEKNCVRNQFAEGTLVIIDLTSPFLDENSACGLFDVVLGLFLSTPVGRGKVVVLDEAHKYLPVGVASHFTATLLSTIRLQRHLAVRLILSTQEPTVIPSEILNLCSYVIVHRFSSPEWCRHLSRHIGSGQELGQWFETAASLRTGEAMLFAPVGLAYSSARTDELDLPGGADMSSADASTKSSRSSSTLIDGSRATTNESTTFNSMTSLNPKSVSGVGLNAQGLTPIGMGYILFQTRRRLTRDGGGSILAVDPESSDESSEESSNESNESNVGEVRSGDEEDDEGDEEEDSHEEEEEEDEEDKEDNDEEEDDEDEDDEESDDDEEEDDDEDDDEDEE